MRIKGIFHIHSSYSYDSEFSLSEIKECLIRLGCSFGVICDHQKDFDQERYAALREDCKRISSDDFRLIPGLEFEFGTVHILGAGLKEYFKPDTIGECLTTIKSQQGLAVWAHPSLKDMAAMRQYLDMLDGVEVWSARYGTKYAPSVRLCDFVRRQRREGINLLAYAGPDAHREDQVNDLCIEMEAGSSGEENILANLANGRFNLVFRSFRVPSTGYLTPWERILFPVMFNGYLLADRAIDAIRAGRKGQGE